MHCKKKKYDKCNAISVMRLMHYDKGNLMNTIWLMQYDK